MPRLLFAMVLVGCVALATAPIWSQGKMPDPKGDPKSMDPKGDLKKPPADPKETLPKKEQKTPVSPAKSPPKELLTLDKLKIPANAIIVLVEELKDPWSLIPKMILVTPERLQELQDRISMLERQLKPDKHYPHSCKLSGRLEGDVLALKADFVFVTQEPHTVVVLGMQGAQLADDGELDKQAAPWLDVTEDGYVVKVEKEGPHQLTLSLRVPVLSRQAITPGAGNERGLDLGLPGAAVTIMNLELPVAVKEIRWNDTLEKSRPPGRWQLSLGKAKKLSLSWKEPAAAPGNGPLLSVESQIQVRLEDTLAQVKADIFLEDLRGQTQEWHLLLPPQARVEVKGPLNLGAQVIAPNGKNPLYVIRLPEPSGERLHVEVQVQMPRPVGKGRLAIGPFLVPKAFRQQGMVSVQAAPEVLRGQRLVFHRLGETYQRDVMKAPAQRDLLAQFQFWNLAGGGQANPKGLPGVPLEIELKTDKGKMETTVDHVLRLRNRPEGQILESVSRIKAKAAFPGTEFLDVQMPRGRLPGQELLLPPQTALAFPATLPHWMAWANAATNQSEAFPLEFFCEEEGGGPAPEIVYLDGQRRARIKLARPQGKEFTLKLTGRYWLPAAARRAQVELPTPRGYLDRGGNKSLIAVDDHLELFVGPPGAEEPVADKHQFQGTWDQAPALVHFSWRPFQLELAVTGVADVTLQDHGAQVRQNLQFTMPARSVRAGQPPGQARLHVPPGVQKLKIVAGGKLHQEGAVAWVLPQSDLPGKVDVTLEYLAPWPEEGVRGADLPPTYALPLIWPEGATKTEAKVRVWAPPQLWPTLDEAKALSGDWAIRNAESAPDKDILPALVVTGSGLTLPLQVRRSEMDSGALAGWLCDRGLIQVMVDEEGRHHYRARYLIRKVSVRHIDVEFPLPVAQCLQQVVIAQKKTPWRPVEAPWTVARIPIDAPLGTEPFLLELEYQLPPAFAEGKRFWQTTMYPPVFKGQLAPPRLRWQIGWPSPGSVVFPLEKNLAVDFRWGWQGWLMGPEPAASSGEMETWLTARDPEGVSTPVTLALWRSGPEPLTILHFPRQFWLLLCSGLFLILAMLVYVIPWPRWMWWGFLLGLVLAMTGLILFWPAWAPVLFLGLQPGLLVVSLLAGVHWLLKERFRRQLVFMPGFTRMQAGSSLLRGKSPPPTREPSTVDAPSQGLHQLAAASELKTKSTPGS